jgi:hypothetical protein
MWLYFLRAAADYRSRVRRLWALRLGANGGSGSGALLALDGSGQSSPVASAARIHSPSFRLMISGRRPGLAAVHDEETGGGGSEGAHGHSGAPIAAEVEMVPVEAVPATVEIIANVGVDRLR